jgi:ectoine hydroxylase-related dioxygenase (phytanoyl-CoA dioxygenase family)
MAEGPITAQSPIPPVLRQVKTHNHLLGDRDALNAAWDANGYWFFRDVLDTDDVAWMRTKFVRYLEKLGVADPVGGTPPEQGVRYNGNDLSQLDHRVESLFKDGDWAEFAARPGVHAFFRDLIGDEPFWLPMTEYRIEPPTTMPEAPRFLAIHQDAAYSGGLAYRICWIPLCEIDERVGGMTVAEGPLRQVIHHDRDENGVAIFGVPPERFDPSVWVRATYRPGDVLVVSPWTPHTGISNLSDRFRMSIDLRLMPENCDDRVVVGTITQFSATAMTVNQRGREITLRITDRSFPRIDSALRATTEQMLDFFKPGLEIMAGAEDGVASVFYPAR